jgi:hypothetical protein
MKLAITPPDVSNPNEPADDLFLDERRDRAGVPDVDALVGHLCEELAHDRDREGWGREVTELARVLGVHQPAGDPRGELLEDVGIRRGPGRRARRSAARSEVGGAQVGVGRRVTHGPGCRLAVQECERRPPGRIAELLEGCP